MRERARTCARPGSPNLGSCNMDRRFRKTKQSKSGTTPHPKRASASAPSEGLKEGERQLPATRTVASTKEDATVHQASSKHTGTSGHGHISSRILSSKHIAGKNRVHSNTNTAGTSGEEAERIQELGHAKAEDCPGSKESTCSAWRTREAATASQGK
jgi:hypothetical protein